MPPEGAGATPPSYAFVTEDNSREGRSHAIRAHWRQRRQRAEMQRREREEQGQRAPKPILPSPGDGSNGGQMARVSPISGPLHYRREPSAEHATGEAPQDPPAPPDRMPEEVLDGIPAQVLLGMNLALGSSRLDPFDRFPVRLASRHHRLLHHWLSTFAGMMFSIHTSTFNPMRDVWFPLDLSNAASFNAIMAHSAAHLARMQGFPVSDEAIWFKIEAVRIVQNWARDPALALGDNTIAAILRLLSFERYWGSEDEWRIHHNGLLQIIEARGGMATLQNNWRLEITTFLVTLMARPSWFDSSNQLREISQQPIATHPVLGQLGNLYKTRCLWLLSCMQDMRTFMSHAPEIHGRGLAGCAFVRDALLLIRSDLYHHEEGIQIESNGNPRGRTRLSCLFYICVMLQGSVSEGYPPGSGNYSISLLDQCLAGSHAQWRDSTESLFQCLFHSTIATQTPPSRLQYALDLTDILCSTSRKARDGVERCMLQILCQVTTATKIAIDYDSTLDSLLACIEGH